MAAKDLTIGNPLKLILGFMFPIYVGNLFQQLYHFVDSLIVGRYLGIHSLAAVGATGPFIFLITSFIFATTQGFSVVTAQKFGAGEYYWVRKSLAASLILSTFLTLILTLISVPFTFYFLKFLNTPENIIATSYKYLYIIFLGIFATVFYNLSSNIIRALGDSKTPLYFLIFASLINIFLDILFIVKYHLDVSGAAFATVVSQGLSTILCMIFMFWKFPVLHLKKNDWNISTDFLFHHLKIGIPMGFQMSILTLGIVALQYVLNSFGSITIASFTLAVRVEQIFNQAFLALGATMGVFSAQNYGAKKISRIEEAAKINIYIVLIISLLSITVLVLFSRKMILWFMTDINEEVIFLAQQYLYVAIIFFVFLGLLLVYRNILQGMGNVLIPLISGLAELFSRAGCAFIFGHYFGYTGICLATPMAWLSGTIVLFIGYKLSLMKNFKKIKGKRNLKI